MKDNCFCSRARVHASSEILREHGLTPRLNKSCISLTVLEFPGNSISFCTCITALKDTMFIQPAIKETLPPPPDNLISNDLHSQWGEKLPTDTHSKNSQMEMLRGGCRIFLRRGAHPGFFLGGDPCTFFSLSFFAEYAQWRGGGANPLHPPRSTPVVSDHSRKWLGVVCYEELFYALI